MMLCRDVRQDINNRIRKESIMRKIISLLLTASLAAALLTGCGGKAPGRQRGGPQRRPFQEDHGHR